MPIRLPFFHIAKHFVNITKYSTCFLSFSATHAHTFFRTCKYLRFHPLRRFCIPSINRYSCAKPTLCYSHYSMQTKTNCGCISAVCFCAFRHMQYFVSKDLWTFRLISAILFWSAKCHINPGVAQLVARQLWELSKVHPSCFLPTPQPLETLSEHGFSLWAKSLQKWFIPHVCYFGTKFHIRFPGVAQLVARVVWEYTRMLWKN